MKKNSWKPRSAPAKDLAEGEARRSFLKLSAAAMAAPLLLRARNATAVDKWVTTPQPIFPPSPPTTPWLEELPTAIVPIEPVSALVPKPTVEANSAAGEAWREPHQRYKEITDHIGQPQLYELAAVEIPNWKFHPDLKAQPLWAYRPAKEDPNNPDTTNPTVLTTILAKYGTPIIFRMYNRLPLKHVGFGAPDVSTHLHNLHTPSESDGFPGDWYNAVTGSDHLPELEDKPRGGGGDYKDHFYPNVYAGYDEQTATFGDPNEALGTLFFHDHCEDFTATNVYRGLAGFYLLFDHLDTGNENDPSPALGLPSGDYDYPLAFGDRRFDANGMLFYDGLHVEGVLGDKVVVNGKIEPVLKVVRRKYRLRLLNSGPSRFYEFYLVDENNQVQEFDYIANDGNLLPRTLRKQTKVRLGVAERADIVVDFSKYPIATKLYLVNRLRQDNTRKPKGVKAPGTPVLQLFVNGDTLEDKSRVPDELRPLPYMPSPEEIAEFRVRRWEFDRKNGVWMINGQIVDVAQTRAKIKKGDYEVWEFEGKGGWAHPIHSHFEEGRILSKSVDGIEVPVPLHEQGRKDVFVLDQTMTIRVLFQYRDFTGRYVLHCHNVIHEDHAMMVRWDIVGEGEEDPRVDVDVDVDD